MCNRRNSRELDIQLDWCSPIGLLLYLVLALGISLVNGCSVYRMSTGEYFAYEFKNEGDHDIEDFMVISPGYGEEFRQPSMRGRGRSYDLYDIGLYGGRKVPDQLAFSWRKLPEPGGERYTGEPVGPYTVKVRERIPREVLSQVHGAGDLQLRLIFTVQNQGVDFRWEVHDYGWEGRGTKILRSGE